MISAKIICDSINEYGNRLTTFELVYPKFIHGEFMTHRQFSRNASSSRAIPTSKYLEEVRSDDLRATPVFWGKNQKGMQAAEELTGKELKLVKDLWRVAALDSAIRAETMANLGVHKQIVNRILEPFLHIRVICTATEYLNFFGLRLDKAAQPEIQALAKAMWTEYKQSVPKPVKFGDWHLPYSSTQDFQELEFDSERIKVSVARCARVSYKSFETGKISTLDEDLALYERLINSQPGHLSPAEHQATPDQKIPTPGQFEGYNLKSWELPEFHGNFVGWKQYRKSLPYENCAPLPPEYLEK